MRDDKCHYRAGRPLALKLRMYSPIRIRENVTDMTVYGIGLRWMDDWIFYADDVSGRWTIPKQKLNILYTLHERVTSVNWLPTDRHLNRPSPVICQTLRDRHLVIAERDGRRSFPLPPQVIEVLDMMRLILRDSLARRTGLVDAENWRTCRARRLWNGANMKGFGLSGSPGW